MSFSKAVNPFFSMFQKSVFHGNECIEAQTNSPLNLNAWHMPLNEKKSNRNYYFVVMVDWKFINHHSNDYRWYLSTQFICFEHLTQIFEFYIHLICTNDGPIFDIHKKKQIENIFLFLQITWFCFCFAQNVKGERKRRAFPNICFWAFLIIIYWIHSLVCRVKVFNWIWLCIEERKRHKDRKRKSVKHFRWHCIKPENAQH